MRRGDMTSRASSILTTLPGVTTLTLLAVATIPLVIAFKLFLRGSVIRILVIVVFAFTAVRTVLFNERLAFLELLLPIIFLVAVPRPGRPSLQMPGPLLTEARLATVLGVDGVHAPSPPAHERSGSALPAQSLVEGLSRCQHDAGVVGDAGELVRRAEEARVAAGAHGCATAADGSGAAAGQRLHRGVADLGHSPQRAGPKARRAMKPEEGPPVAGDEERLQPGPLSGRDRALVEGDGTGDDERTVALLP